MSDATVGGGGGFRCTRKLTLAMSGGVIILVIALTVGLCVGLSGSDSGAQEVSLISYLHMFFLYT